MLNRDELILMAREADPFGEDGKLFSLAAATPKTLERFAALVAAAEREACLRHYKVAIRNAVTAEREACAKVCDDESDVLDPVAEADEAFEARACAKKIRARGDA